MDHLPIPKNVVTNERATVPYVCRKDYDGGPFLAYPIIEHVPHALPQDGTIPDSTPYCQHELLYPTPKQEQEDFLQRWLFFGLIHEILGDRYKPEHLIRTIETENGTTKVVATLGLVEALDKWIADVQRSAVHAGSVSAGHTYEHIAECLRLAFATIRGAGPDFDLRIKVSLASLGEIFALAGDKAHESRDKGPKFFPILVNDVYWKDLMLSSGWCPSQIKENLGNHFSLQTLHFFTFLSQPASDGLHGRCSDDRCLAYHNDLATYQTKHVAGCDCEHFSVDTKRLTEILESGFLPLLRIQKGHTLSELSVKLISSQSTSRYIALSHVWADGLGNPYENALPRCQLDLLRQIIDKYDAAINPHAVDGILLWCDTLCCPVKPGKSKNMALARMKTTYLEATRVLVLDASLRMFDFKTMDVDEDCARIFNSGWTRRLWTLQEGTLPAKNSRLAFLFKDEAINMSYLFSRMLQTFESDLGRRGFATDITTRIAMFAYFPHEYDGDRREDLGTVEVGLQRRAVSVPADEPLLITNLLGLDLAHVLNGPCPLANCAKVGCDDSRVHRMWSLMPTAFRGIPRNILLRVSPRLSEPGFRWAPSTLLYFESLNHPLYPRMRIKNEVAPTTNGPIFGPQGVMFSPLIHLFPVLMSTFWDRLVDFSFCMRATLETVSWIPAILRNLKVASAVTESADRGIPTSRGLLVRFSGYSFSMAHCSPGVPSSTCNMKTQKSGLFSRGIDGTWYFITRRLPAERDSFLSTKTLRAIIQEEGDLWITLLDSAFNNPDLVVKANAGTQQTLGLLVQLLSDEEGIKYVQTKLHIVISVVKKSTRTLLEAACRSAKQISRNLPAELTAAKSDGEQNERNDKVSPQCKSMEALVQEMIHEVAIQNTRPDVTAAAAALSRDGSALFRDWIAMMLVGGYGCLGAGTGEEQQWCFD